MSVTRDMSRKQFETALVKRGFQSYGLLGYWRLPAPHTLSACEMNGGDRLRDRLAYLLNVLDREERKAPHD